MAEKEAGGAPAERVPATQLTDREWSLLVGGLMIGFGCATGLMQIASAIATAWR